MWIDPELLLRLRSTYCIRVIGKEERMREQIDTYDALGETLDGLHNGGLLLVTGAGGNPMVIGWGTVGQIWGRSVFVVLVRPSRYSFSLIEALPEFTVNVPAADHGKALAVCGSKSGRDTDKIAMCGFSLGSSESVSVPYISECPVHYECRVIHKSNVVNADLDQGIIPEYYASGDFHRVYYGEILGVYREG